MRVLIADDHPIFRAGLKEILSKERDVDSLGEADNGHAVLELARKERWDLVLLDITMPGKDGIDVLHDLQREYPKLPVLILSAHPEDQLGLRLPKAGAAGYLTKDKAPEALIAAIRKILAGGKYVSPSLGEQAVQRLTSEAADPLHELLTDREFQVMRMIAKGQSVKQIGKELFISPQTVSTYRFRVLEKMQMKTNADLMRYAIEKKLLE
jgi:DNA-binding NarL/FixJ family response regulator